MNITQDTTDADGIRNVTIQTTATGNDNDGYKAAERQAHEWFYAHYDGLSRLLLKKGLGETAIVELALKCGVLDPHFLRCSHPQIIEKGKQHMFGHHWGVNPTTADGTWGFQFKIIPIEKQKKTK